MGTMSVSVSIGLFLALSLSSVTFGLPQVSPVGDVSSSSLIDSPWSQWMSLKAPPMATPGGKSKKKKLLPGPAPPEGTPEAPWVSWTRMKVSSTLFPPAPLSSIPVASSTDDSTPKPAVYMQWAQMKLPLANPAVAPTPPLKKRMAPDRYNIVSTVEPRLAGYGPSQQGGLPRPQVNRTFYSPSSYSPSPSRPSSPAQTYLDLFGLSSSPNVNSRPTSMMSGATPSFPNLMNSPSAPTPSAKPVSPAAILATILKPLPHQIVSQILAYGTPQELTLLVEAISSLNDEDRPIPLGVIIKVGDILPPSFLPKIPDELTPLLTTPLLMPPPPSPPELSLVPDEPLRQAILKLASPSEATAVLGTLSQIESLPPSQQAPIASLQVKTILPPTLLTKVQSLSPSLTPMLEKTLAPPILQKALPPPILSALLTSSTPSELTSLIEILSEVEKLPKTYPAPLIGTILPASVLTKLPPQLAPLLSMPVMTTSLPTSKVPSSPVPSPVLSSALPPPVYAEVIAKATPEELKDIVETVALLQAAVPAIASPPIIKVLPPALVPKLSPEVKPLLSQPLVLPSTSPLAILPAPILEAVLKVATPEEIPEIVENIAEALEKPADGLPVKAVDLLPPSVIAKLPPQVLSELETPIPIPQSPKALSVLSALLPQPILQAIQATATPEELTTLSTTLTELETTPPALQPMIEKLEVGTILPPSLVAKLPPSILPLLKASLKMSPPTLAPATIPPPIPSPAATILSDLSLAPKSVVTAILSAATPTELAELSVTLKELEAVPPQLRPLVGPVQLGTILPSTLLPRLPPSILPLLSAPVVLPAPISAPAEVKPSPTEAIVSSAPPPETIQILSSVISGLSPAPKPVLAGILAVATPPELTELAETLTTLALDSSIPPLPIKAILPPSLLPKLPSQLAPLLSTPITIPLPNPALTPILSSVIPVISKAPKPIPTLILSIATPSELEELAETLKKLEEISPQLKPLVEPVQLGTILPASLLPRLPPSVLPLLSTPIDVPVTPSSPLGTIAPPPPPQVLPTKASPNVLATLSAILPMSVAKTILAAATPEELMALSTTVTELEATPPQLRPLIGKVDLETIIPPSLQAKLPAPILPLLNTPLKTPLPPKTPAMPVPPVISKIVSELSLAPKPVLSAIIRTATLPELTELSETLTKLEDVPPASKPLVKSLELGTILPATLPPRLPPSILPLLSTPLMLPAPVEVTPLPVGALSPVPTPTSVAPSPTAISPVAPTPLDIVVSALSLAPKPVLTAILTTATTQEITELSEVIKKLEEIPPESKPLLKSLALGTILPATLLPRLPPSLLPLLSAPIELPAPLNVPAGVTPLPAAPISSLPSPPPAEIIPVLSTIISGLSPVPKPVLTAILGVASPPELTELAETLITLEADKSIPPLPILAILPPSLLPKLPSQLAPLLSIPLTIPPPNPALTPILTSVIPVISSAPKPIPTLILSLATPAELEELAETITKLEAVSPEQKPLLTQLELGTILPPSLKVKLPPPVLPLLSSPLVLPSAVEPATPAIPPRVLQVIPEPVLSPIMTLASPVELKELTETLSKLEAIPPEQLSLLPKIPLVNILPPSLVQKLPPTLAPFLSENLELPPQATPMAALLRPVPSPLPPLPKVDDTLPLTLAEKKLLTKWAKVILEKTGNPAAAPPIPGEIPPLQAAWMEWVQLKANKTTPKALPPIATIANEATTEYPWTKSLKLMGNVTEVTSSLPLPPPLDVTTDSPEKAVLDWLEGMEKAPTGPGLIPPPTTPLVGVSPVTEEKVAEILKQLGIDIVDLPPEQIAALLQELEKTAPPAPMPTKVGPGTPPAAPAMAYPPYSFYPPPPFYSPFMPTKPYLPYWAPPPSPFSPQTLPSPPVDQVIPPPSPTPPTPTINLTEYLIQNKLIPAETPPTASIPIPILAKLLEEQALAPSSPELPPDSTEQPGVTAAELASLTPTKFAALLKQILKDCNRTNSLVPRSAMNPFLGIGVGGGDGASPPSPFFNKGAYYKQKYAGLKKSKPRALYPIPSTAFIPQSSPSPVENLLPLPKLDMNTTGSIIDPAYWAAQKSLFLSKLFSTLAKVATSDSSTPSPKDQLAKQVNNVLMTDMTRSIKHHHRPQPPPQPIQEEDSSEYEESSEAQTSAENDEDDQPEPSAPEGVNEKQLVTNDDSQPKLPKEPENPLHKLFKFGVQKTVLSDLSTEPPPPQPYYVYITPPPQPQPPPTFFDGGRESMPKLKSKVIHGKTKKKKFHGPSPSSRHHHPHSKKLSNFRGPTTTTTTDNPVDFELLAKALLMDKTGAKRSPSSQRK